MSTQTVLVIDDSSTIRKMVDSHLSQAGYRVVLAPTAEQGLELAPQIQPDLILLDHQLPGTTGIEVCRKIIAMPECMQIPFVISSTLRKQAYIEYMDVPNVVDSLPKPFKPELLKMTVANALEVGALIVASQAAGTAVPEVVEEVSQANLSGDFNCCSLRELLDFLNNGAKQGVLEVELERDRVSFAVKDGRIQSVVSASIQAEAVIPTLPPTLAELAPLLKFTLSSGFNSQVDGLVELLDKRMLDPRILRTLLRHQAAYLTAYCLESRQVGFSFSAGREVPPLFRRSPLEMSLAALLVEASAQQLFKNAPATDDCGWVRKGVRGQNLDRSGLNAKQVQLLSQVTQEPQATEDLARQVGMDCEEAARCLQGFAFADWISAERMLAGHHLIALESDPVGWGMIREQLQAGGGNWTGKAVRDEFGLQLLLNRQAPDALLIEVSGDETLQLPGCLADRAREWIARGTLAVILPEGNEHPPLANDLQELPRLQRPFVRGQLVSLLEELQSNLECSAHQSRDSASHDQINNSHRPSAMLVAAER